MRHVLSLMGLGVRRQAEPEALAGGGPSLTRRCTFGLTPLLFLGLLGCNGEQEPTEATAEKVRVEQSEKVSSTSKASQKREDPASSKVEAASLPPSPPPPKSDRPPQMPCRVEEWSGHEMTRAWTLVYDANGHLRRAREQVTGARAARESFGIGFEYDDDGRLLRYAVSAEPESGIRFVYDEKGELRGMVSNGRFQAIIKEAGAALKVQARSLAMGDMLQECTLMGSHRKQTWPVPSVIGRTVFLGDAMCKLHLLERDKVRDLSEAVFDASNKHVAHRIIGGERELRFIFECKQEWRFEQLGAAELDELPSPEQTQEAWDEMERTQLAWKNETRNSVDELRQLMHAAAKDCEKKKNELRDWLVRDIGVSREDAESVWARIKPGDRVTTRLSQIILGMKDELSVPWISVAQLSVLASLLKPCEEALTEVWQGSWDGCMKSGAKQELNWIRFAAAEACGLDAQTPSYTECASDRAKKKATELHDWAFYRCRAEDEVGDLWSKCLESKKYKTSKFGGCQGELRCCPNPWPLLSESETVQVQMTPP